MYEIEGQRISHEDYQQMLANLKLDPDEFLECKRDGNQLYIDLASPTDFSRGFFTMTEEEGEKLAWELFRKIPFMEGEYECLGIGDTCRYYDSQGIHIPRAGYVFCRTLDGVPVVGDESCVLHLDGSGLVAVSIRLYDYENVGTMDLVPLEAAKAKLKSPDDFDIGTASTQPYVKTVETLEVDQVSLRLVNQHSRKCEILQPVYYFTGEATYADGYEADFSSKVIAIPESYTD
jgi:hypothetical protein